MSAKPWFPWYPADHRSKAAHLNFVQCCAYRRLIDAYMERQAPLPVDRPALYRLTAAMTDDERAAVDHVASQFFSENANELHHQRCNEEIVKAKAAHDRWVEGGRKGGLSSAQGRLKAGSSNPQPQSQSQNTAIKEKPSGGAAAVPPMFDEAWKAYPTRNGNNTRGDALKAWNSRLREGADAKAMLDGTVRYAAWCKAMGKVNTEHVMQGSRFYGSNKPYEQAFNAPVDARASKQAQIFTEGENHGISAVRTF